MRENSTFIQKTHKVIAVADDDIISNFLIFFVAYKFGSFRIHLSI